MKSRLSLLVSLLLLVMSALSSCRGYRSSETPIHPNPNMYFTARFNPQKLSRTPPADTVAWGSQTAFPEADALKEDSAVYSGKNEAGGFVTRIPVKVDLALVYRGKERYEIYCAVCHASDGSGKSKVAERGLPPVPKLFESRIRSYTDGEIYNIVMNGIRNMPAYKKQIETSDRWAIVAYVRALQRAQPAALSDLPASRQTDLP